MNKIIKRLLEDLWMIAVVVVLISNVLERDWLWIIAFSIMLFIYLILHAKQEYEQN